MMKSAPSGCKLAPVIGCEHALAQHLVSYLHKAALVSGAKQPLAALIGNKPPKDGADYGRRVS